MIDAKFDEYDSRDQMAGGLGVWGLLRHLRVYFRPELWRCLCVALLVVMQAVAGRAIVVVFGLAIDRGILAKDYAYILYAATAYFVLEMIAMVLQISVLNWFARIGNRVLHRLRDHLTQHVQALPASYFDRVPTGKIVTRLTADTVSLTELFNQGLLSVFSSVIAMLTIVAAMLMISVKMTLITLLVAPPLIFIGLYLSDRILTAQRESKRRISMINAFVAESVAGMRLIQLFNQVWPQRHRFEELSATYKNDMMKVVSLYAMFYPTVSLFTAVSVATALVVGGKLAFSGVVTTGAMIAFIFHVKDFGDPLRNILERYQLLQNSVSSGERIFSLLNEATEDNGGVKMPPRPIQGRVTFENVSFRYGEGLPLALNNLNFEIQPGTTLAVVGRTGSGKSTLISLLQRFRDPVGGRILIDGLPLNQFERTEVRRVIGVVQQDVFLFRGTIGENISLSDPTISLETIQSSAKEAGLTRLIEMRPGGLNALVEEKGANLSLGERQLIAFARILAFDCDILVLDEATASVDSETERLLQEASARARRGRTSIIIAHRLSTISDVDRVLVLRDGAMIELDSPANLMATDSVFRELAETQKTFSVEN